MAIILILLIRFHKSPASYLRTYSVIGTTEAMLFPLCPFVGFGLQNRSSSCATAEDGLAGRALSFPLEPSLIYRQFIDKRLFCWEETLDCGDAFVIGRQAETGDGGRL